jgi:hypothetical protein
MLSSEASTMFALRTTASYAPILLHMFFRI